MTNKNICQECGMTIKQDEFHPYEFCVLWKNRIDPRNLYKQIVKHEKDQKTKE